MPVNSHVTLRWFIFYQFSVGGIFPSAIRLDLLKLVSTKESREENEDHISLEVHRDSLMKGKSAIRDDRDFQAKDVLAGASKGQ